MRETEYRGFSKLDKEWVYGVAALYRHSGECFIVDEWGDMVSVYSTSVGQWTGRCDSAGTRIFEGDIVRVTYCPYNSVTDRDDKEYLFTGCVVWDNLRACYLAVDEEGTPRYRPFEYQIIDIVGNAYEGVSKD